jgi:regulator of replication initiation timing
VAKYQAQVKQVEAECEELRKKLALSIEKSTGLESELDEIRKRNMETHNLDA